MKSHSDEEGEFEKEVAIEEGERAFRAEWITHDADGAAIITDYVDDRHFIELLEKTAKHLATGTQMPTKPITDRAGRKMTVLTRTGTDLIALCSLFDPAFTTRHGHHVFNPWIKVMLVALCHWAGPAGFGVPFPDIGILPEDRINLDRIVRFVRRVCATQVFARVLKDERRLALQNLRSACGLMISLFARHSRLLILRLDLYYKGEGKAWARTDEAEAAFQRFMRMLRAGRIVPDVLGCLSRREEGPERGIHYHILVAMDGHKRKDAYGHTEVIGKRWVEHYAGRGRGSFFNCYTKRHAYRFNGLGLVHLSDWRMLIGLRIALRYITKPEYQVKDRRDRLRNGKRGVGKSFRRSLIKRDDVKLGAHRKVGHELSTVLRILGV